jgi:hypothetical protein
LGEVRVLSEFDLENPEQEQLDDVLDALHGCPGRAQLVVQALKDVIRLAVGVVNGGAAHSNQE